MNNHTDEPDERVELSNLVRNRFRSVQEVIAARLLDLGISLRSPRSQLIAVSFLPVFAAIHVAAYWLRFDTFTDRRWLQLSCTLTAVLVIKTFLFSYYRIYQSWSRYATFYDLITLVKAASISAVCLALVDYLFLATLPTPRAVFFMDWGATIVLVGGLRALRRWMNEGLLHWESEHGSPALIVGANDYGESVLRAIRRSKRASYKVIGFVSERRESVGSRISGIPVVGSVDQTISLAKSYDVSDLLIASRGLNGKRVREIVNFAEEHGISVKVLPSFDQILDGQIDFRPRKVSISDLLRRDPVQLDTEYLEQWLEGKVLFVTGAAGSIGSEICRQLLPYKPAKLVVVDRSENGQFFLEKDLRRSFPSSEICVCVGDIADQQRMTDLFRQYRPDVVFHAAAYKHVPLMEMNCSEAVRNIPVATKTLADLADRFGIHSFVMISTDKAVNPTSVMGCCKRVAEIYVQALAQHSSCRFVTVRFGNVLGSNGSVVPIFAKQIARGGPVTVTHPDMQRYFMMIPEASQLVIQAGAMGNGGEIFVLDMGDPVRIVDLAHDMIRLSGLRVGEDIEINFSGVRPGEKLFEELHITGETHVATKHPKIMVAKCHESTIEEISRSIQRLQLAARQSDDNIVEELKNIVPEFQPTRFGQPDSGHDRKAA